MATSTPPQRVDVEALLIEVADVLNTTLDLDTLLQRVAEVVKRVINYEIFSILLLNERAQELRIRFQIGHFQRAVGIDHDLHGPLDRRRPVVVLDAVFGAIERAHIGAAAHVIAGHMQLEVRQAIAQEYHPLTCIRCVDAMRVFFDELLEGVEGLLGVDRRTLR